ncbi:hypothetical protein F0562_001893 [Nyssa sinensis]|uniref:Uncharacterized protein n=1 Tax=Nyssa sinensis TaxID=561372 RepID=A0A5J5C4Y6_9ASTE|nr:hypothetical protein F0562_001893 [Nyssa sinensis]
MINLSKALLLVLTRLKKSPSFSRTTMDQEEASSSQQGFAKPEPLKVNLKLSQVCLSPFNDCLFRILSINQANRVVFPFVHHDKDSISMVVSVAKNVEGIGLSRPSLVWDVGELRELIQSVQLSKAPKKKRRMGMSHFVGGVQPNSSAKRAKTSLSFHDASLVVTRLSHEGLVQLQAHLAIEEDEKDLAELIVGHQAAR